MIKDNYRIILLCIIMLVYSCFYGFVVIEKIFKEIFYVNYFEIKKRKFYLLLVRVIFWLYEFFEEG